MNSRRHKAVGGRERPQFPIPKQEKVVGIEEFMFQRHRPLPNKTITISARFLSSPELRFYYLLQVQVRQDKKLEADYTPGKFSQCLEDSHLSRSIQMDALLDTIICEERKANTFEDIYQRSINRVSQEMNQNGGFLKRMPRMYDSRNKWRRSTAAHLSALLRSWPFWLAISSCRIDAQGQWSLGSFRKLKLEQLSSQRKPYAYLWPRSEECIMSQ